TYFLKSGKGNSELTESLKAISTDELAPISYEYTSLVGKSSKTIDAQFKAGTMTAVIKTDGKIQKVDKKIPKGTFLSTFLVYLMLKSKDGLRAETKYEYQAIAEEDAEIRKGEALVGKEETFNGVKVFKILNTFKDSKFLSYVNDHGEMIGTNALGLGITTELVANSADATTGQSFSSTILKTLFGAVPEGKKNVLAQAQSPSGPVKKVIPVDQGLTIKAPQPTPTPIPTPTPKPPPAKDEKKQ
ncbi:MAG TPA: hypothetical protein VN132_05765, partial [Bdellovibrio sp.]|nr:hypothetical protein [Bdellovibrio sp.]